MKTAIRKTHEEVTRTGDALANACFQRGTALTQDEREALAHWGRWGSDGYPVRKIGRVWSIEHRIGHWPCYPTKWQAVEAWEIIIAKLIRMKGLERHSELMKAG